MTTSWTQARARKNAPPPKRDSGIPEYAWREFGSPYGWRLAKRAEIRAALKTLKAVQYGCSFLPDHGRAVKAAQEAIERLNVMCREYSWARGDQTP